MELDDPISDKFRTLLEALMAKTTSEIVKVFADVLLETRVEISRSWKKIDELKQELERREEQREKSKSQTTQVTFKWEENDVQQNPSHENPQISVSVPCTDESIVIESQDELQIPKDPKDNINNIAAVAEPVISKIATAATSDCASLLNQNLEVVAIQSTVKNKETHPHQCAKECQTSLTGFKTKTKLVVDNQQPSTSTNVILLDSKSEETGAAVSKKTYLQKHVSPTNDETTPHMLRGRQFRSQRPCLCCSFEQCSDQNEPKRTTTAEVPLVYTCNDCEKTFQDKMELKGHKCSIVCNRCGQSFPNIKALNTHSQGVYTGSKRVFPFRCYLCSQMFATLCGWNMHKRIHTHESLSETDHTTEENIPSSSQSVTVPKDLNSMLQVRLERIPHAQLEAALSYKSSPSISNKNDLIAPASQLPSVAENTVPTGSKPSVEVIDAPQLNEEPIIESGTKNIIVGQGSSLGARMSDSEDVKDVAVVPSSSAKIQLREKRTMTKTPTLHSSEETVMRLNSRKRKLADCNHDVYNGVFPVEKILKWRKIKGQDEVRIKWMPCSSCGAKWKNTWEPADSFISYKDGKKGPKSKEKQK